LLSVFIPLDNSMPTDPTEAASPTKLALSCDVWVYPNMGHGGRGRIVSHARESLT